MASPSRRASASLLHFAKPKGEPKIQPELNPKLQTKRWENLTKGDMARLTSLGASVERKEEVYLLTGDRGVFATRIAYVVKQAGRVQYSAKLPRARKAQP